MEKKIKSKGYAAKSSTSPLGPFEFSRRAVNPDDVLIDIMYCGVCHSDIHTARNEWEGTKYPVVPGHEIIGKVAEMGSSVKNFKIGEIVGVGCMVGSCGKCEACKSGHEQFCLKGATFTYNGKENTIGGQTYGGYSNNIVLSKDFVIKIPKTINDLSAAAPLLCAGITTYSPLARYKVSKGQRIGVVGLGGLGHMAVKIGHSMGAEVIVLTTSKEKFKEAERLGAKGSILLNDDKMINENRNSFDFIIDTVSAPHEIKRLLHLLKVSGNMVLVGAPHKSFEISADDLIFGLRSLSGSLIGGVKETQEMMEYCAKHGILCDIELIPIQKVNEAYDRVVKSDVKYRFVIDMKSLNR